VTVSIEGVLIMRNFMGMLALLLAATPLVSSGQAIQESAACEGNGTEIIIVAQKFAEGPPAYTFRIVNGTESPVLSVVLGRGARLHISPHTPTSMGAPIGWQASHTIGHESPYLYYRWIAETSEGQLQSGQSLSGFSVQLDAWEPEQPRFFLDEPVVQEDLRSISFFVRLENGACYTGSVRPDGL
jgi:hypothetical protein